MEKEVRTILRNAVTDRHSAPRNLVEFTRACFATLDGVAIVPAGRRKDALEAAMTRWLDEGFGKRILPFDSAAARSYAAIAADRRHLAKSTTSRRASVAACVGQMMISICLSFIADRLWRRLAPVDWCQRNEALLFSTASMAD